MAERASEPMRAAAPSASNDNIVRAAAHVNSIFHADCRRAVRRSTGGKLLHDNVVLRRLGIAHAVLRRASVHWYKLLPDNTVLRRLGAAQAAPSRAPIHGRKLPSDNAVLV